LSLEGIFGYTDNYIGNGKHFNIKFFISIVKRTQRVIG